MLIRTGKKRSLSIKGVIRMKLSVCIDSVCRGWDLSEAFSIVKMSGFDAFEFWNWRRKDIGRLANEMQRFDLTLAAFCTVGGTLVDRESHKDYLNGLKEAVCIARRLGCSMLITTAGNELPGVPREQQLENVAFGLQSAVPIVEDAGITLVLEPLNTIVDHPGHLLSRSIEAFDVIDYVGSKQLKVLFDVYHQQITEGNLIETITGRLSSIGHIHAAGCPGRHELQFGEIQYANLFQALRSAGYSNYIGLEYVPSLDAAEGLENARKLLESS
jgi:hydroxypyruvate isomerase